MAQGNIEPDRFSFSIWVLWTSSKQSGTVAIVVVVFVDDVGCFVVYDAAHFVLLGATCVLSLLNHALPY
jgi:hypothetical protein